MFQTAVRGIADFFFKQNFDSLIGYWDAGCHPTLYPVFQNWFFNWHSCDFKEEAASPEEIRANHLMHVLLC